MKFSNRQRRILYAEDNEDSRELVSVQCELSGIKVVTAQTVGEAWRTAQNEFFNLYLLDSRFPDGDGLDLCRRLRSLAPLSPILFYSGDAYEAHKQNGLAAGANGYLTKPYMADLAETISETIEKSEEFAAAKSGVSLYQTV